MKRRRRAAAFVLTVIVVVLVGSSTFAGAADDPPALLGDSPITVTKAKPAQVSATATGAVRLSIVGDASVAVRCLKVADASGLCLPNGGIVTLEVSTTATTKTTATLVVLEVETARSTSRSVVVPGLDQPTQPKKYTIAVEGCSSWYDTELFGCETQGPVALPGELDAPVGAAVVSGAAGLGTVTVQPKGSTATVSGLDGFGESSGTLGSGDSALEVTVRRRAPILFGWVVVLFGAAFAALFGFFTDWAGQKSASDIAHAAYGAKHDKVMLRRSGLASKLDARGFSIYSSQWGLELEPARSTPQDLSDEESELPASVAAYAAAADEAATKWAGLEELLDTHGAVARARPDAQLGYWVRSRISRGPTDSEYAVALGLSAVVRECLEEWTDQDLLDALFNAATTPEVQSAVVGFRPKPKDVGPNKGRAMPGARYELMEIDGVGAAPHPTKSGSSIPRNGAVIAPLVVITVGVALAFSRPTAFAVALYLVGLGALVVGVGVARREKKVPVLVAAFIGWILAAAFGGADALNGSVGWGSFGDIAKTVGASFVIAGTAQVLRFGFPKVPAGDAKK